MRVASLLLGTIVAASGWSEQIFYAGDLEPATTPEFHVFFGPNRRFERFTIGHESVVTQLYGHHFIAPSKTIAVEWDIRTGMGQGNGGSILHQSSNVLATVTETGRTLPGWTVPECKITISGLNLLLPEGTYWMSLRPFTDSAALSGTNGVNGIRSTVGDHTSIVYGPTHPNLYNMTSNDWSYGVEGYAVPEPVSLTGIGLGAIAYFRRSRRRVA